VLTGGSRIGGHHANRPRCVGQPYTLRWRPRSDRSGRREFRKGGTRVPVTRFGSQPPGGSGSWPNGGIGVNDHGGEPPPVVPDRSSVHPSYVFSQWW